jgi:hypothetical protein
MKNSIIVLLIIVAFSSCTKVIDIDLNKTSPQLVIQADITNLAGPYIVKLNNSVNFSDPNVLPGVPNAFITITDNVGNKDTLTSTSTIGEYKTTFIQGIQGRTYTLNVSVNGNTYNAISTMPTINTIDSVRFLQSSFGGGSGPGGQTIEPPYNAIPYFIDPIQIGNYYRFIQRVNGKKDNSILLDNDNLINGLQYQRPIFSQGTDMKLGDTLDLELHSIDKVTYDYFNTLSLSLGSGPGGGTTPANPETNIVGKDVLGYFSAYSVDKKTVIVKK